MVVDIRPRLSSKNTRSGGQFSRPRRSIEVSGEMTRGVGLGVFRKCPHCHWLKEIPRTAVSIAYSGVGMGEDAKRWDIHCFSCLVGKTGVAGDFFL